MTPRAARAQKPTQEIPWRLLLSKAPVWALIVCHFCHNWGTFILLTWMPTYYNQARLCLNAQIQSPSGVAAPLMMPKPL